MAFRLFQHTAARRRLPLLYCQIIHFLAFQHTAARRRLLNSLGNLFRLAIVSTHSRPKAAAVDLLNFRLRLFCFNTQPPEGGCSSGWIFLPSHFCFNTQPPEGGCRGIFFLCCSIVPVSTHSRPKAAGREQEERDRLARVSTHSRPKAAAI